jgi:hypothetical protein
MTFPPNQEQQYQRNNAGEEGNIYINERKIEHYDKYTDNRKNVKDILLLFSYKLMCF